MTKQTTSQERRHATTMGRTDGGVADEHGPAIFTVHLPGPLDVGASLELFRRAGDDRIDRWDGAILVRTLPLPSTIGAQHVAYCCELLGTLAAPALRVTVAEAAHAGAVRDAVASTFVAAPSDFAALVASDPVIARLDARYPGVRPVRQFELFAALVRCISAQQVNLRWAATTRARLAEAFGTRHEVAGHSVYSLDAARFAALSVEQIRALQFTTRKAEYILAAAEAIASGALDVARLADLPDDDAIAALEGLRGIGRWTAEWILARMLGRPRVVAGDLALRKAVGAAYLGLPAKGPLPSEAEVRRATAHWGPSAGVAQQLLLQGYGAGTLAT